MLVYLFCCVSQRYGQLLMTFYRSVAYGSVNIYINNEVGYEVCLSFLKI